MKALIIALFTALKGLFRQTPITSEVPATPAAETPVQRGRPATYRPRQELTTECQHCGNAFTTTSKRTQYCSNSCRTLAYNARKALE